MALLHKAGLPRRLAAIAVTVAAALLAVAGTLTPALAATPTAANSPSMVVNGADLDIAAQGPNNSLLFYWAVNGTSTWHTVTVAGAGTTFSAPSMAVDGGSVIIAAQGPNNSLMFYWTFDPASSWNPEPVAGAATTFSAPSVATDNHSVDIVAQGPGGTMYSYYAVNGSSTWATQLVGGSLISPGATSAPAVVMAGGLVNVAVQTNFYDLTFYSQPIGGAQDTWHGSGLAEGVSPPSITATGNAINISTTSISGGVRFYWAYFGSVEWTTETVVSTGIYTLTSIATDSSTNAAVIAATESDGQLDFFSAVYGTGSWQHELVSGANTVESNSVPPPAPVIIPDSVNGYNGVDISAVTPGGQLLLDYSAFRSGTWYSEAVPGNGLGGRL